MSVFVIPSVQGTNSYCSHQKLIIVEFEWASENHARIALTLMALIWTDVPTSGSTSSTLTTGLEQVAPIPSDSNAATTTITNKSAAFFILAKKSQMYRWPIGVSVVVCGKRQDIVSVIYAETGAISK